MAAPLYAGYHRISRIGKREEDKLQSPKLAAEAITRKAEAAGVRVRLFEPEVDVSGSRSSRKTLDRIIAGIESGEFAGIIVKNLSRLSRLPARDRLELFERIEGIGGVILSAEENLDVSTPEGRFVRELFLNLARMEWERYAEGFDRAKGNAIASGIPIQKRPPVGYVKGEDRRLYPNPETAPHVTEAFRMRAAGKGPREICDYLNGHEVFTTLGGHWTNAELPTLFRNRIYLGEISYGRNRDGTRKYVNPSAHEALVDLGTWEAAQGAKRTRRSVGETSPWLLNGLARCAGCGYVLIGTRDNARPGQEVYRCRRSHAAGTCPAPVRIRAHVLEETAERLFWDLLRDAHAKGAKVDTGAEERAKLVAEEERTERLVADYLAPEVQEAIGDMALWAAGLRERREAHEAAALAVAEHRAMTEHEEALPTEEALREEAKTWSIPEHREALALVLDFLAVTPDHKVGIYPKGTAPAGLPRPGRKAPSLVPIPVEAGTPYGAGVALG